MSIFACLVHGVVVDSAQCEFDLDHNLSRDQGIGGFRVRDQGLGDIGLRFMGGCSCSVRVPP